MTESEDRSERVEFIKILDDSGLTGDLDLFALSDEEFSKVEGEVFRLSKERTLLAQVKLREEICEAKKKNDSNTIKKLIISNPEFFLSDGEFDLLIENIGCLSGAMFFYEIGNELNRSIDDDHRTRSILELTKCFYKEAFGLKPNHFFDDFLEWVVANKDERLIIFFYRGLRHGSPFDSVGEIGTFSASVSLDTCFEPSTQKNLRDYVQKLKCSSPDLT